MERLKQVLNSPLGRRKNGVYSPKVFGVSLEELSKTHHARSSVAGSDTGPQGSTQVPFIVDRISRHIFANGIEEEGIFRVNGNARVIEKLKECFEKHGDADLESAEDIFAVAGLLKLFLRELPEAIIPESMTSQFVRCQEASKQDKNECIRQLKVLVGDLPKRHYDLLKYLMRFLVDVAAKDSNKMSPMGLAIVFGPNLFRCSAGIEGLRDQGVTNEIVCKFLLEYSTLFGELTEPGPFTIPYIHQHRRKNREKRRQAPQRPPPPKLAENSTSSLAVPIEVSEDLRPTTSLSQEFMERASPFTIADGDGHSSIASPVLSAVASELVTKTISEAVLEHIFSETEVRSIFDHWGECDDSSRNSTPHGSVSSRRHTTNTTANTVHEDTVTSPTSHRSSHSSADVIVPQPRPRTTAVIVEERNPEPQPMPRMQRQISRSSDTSTENYSTEPPKPKPRTKSAPTRHGTLSDVLHYSIDMPVVSGKQQTFENEPEIQRHVEIMVTSNNDCVDEFDSITSSATKLQHFTKPKGPVKTVARKYKSQSTLTKRPSEADGGDASDGRDGVKPSNHSDFNNNESDRLGNAAGDAVVPKLDLNQLDDKPTARPAQPSAVVIIHKVSNGEMTPPPAPTSLGCSVNSTDMLDTGAEENLLSTTPNNPMEGLTPEPKRLHRNTADDEQRAVQIKTLNKKINALKKKVKLFEESFEAEHGHKPSTQEKNAKLEIKKALLELSKCRKELRNVKEQGTDNSRTDSIEPPMAATENDASRAESVVNIGTSSEPPTMAGTLELLLKRLKDKRQEANRADDINTLTRDQVQEEKLAVQKALLHFESIHGRPQTKSEKELMRPLYDRYRQIKKALATAPISKPQQKETAESEPSAGEATVAEADPAEMLVTQHPDMTTQQSLPNGEEDEQSESPAAREANLQDLPVSELKSELDKANGTKKRLRKLLRDFEDEFQKENSRKVQREDRGPMDSKYQEYKHIKARIKLLEVLLSKQEST